MKVEDNRSWGRRLIDGIKELITKIKRTVTGKKAQDAASVAATGQKLSQVEEAVKLWEKGLKVATKAVKTDKATNNGRSISPGRARAERAKNNTAQGGGKYAISITYQDEVRDWYKDGMPNGEIFALGSTGPVLQGLGAIESDIYIEGDKIRTILEQHPEMSIKEIQNIPTILEDPVLIMKSQNAAKVKSNSRLVIFGSIKAKDGNSVLCVLDLRPVDKGLVLHNMQKVVSAYTKDINPKNYFQNSEVLYADKKGSIINVGVRREPGPKVIK